MGGDIYLWELAKGLTKFGHKVTVISTYYEGCKSEDFKDGVKIIRIKGFLTLPFRIFSKYLLVYRKKVDVIIEETIGGQRIPYLANLFVRKPLIGVWHQKHKIIFHEQYPFFIKPI